MSDRKPEQNEDESELSRILPGVIIHFTPESSGDGSSEESLDNKSFELISPGQILLSLDSASKSSKVSLATGEYTELSSDGLELLSICHGYPTVAVSGSKGEQKAGVTVLPLIDVASDKMEAVLNLYPRSGSVVQFQETIEQALKDRQVVFGLERPVIINALEIIEETGQPLLTQIVARGKSPLHGQNAYIRFEVEIGPLPGKLLADGTIDFRERLMFVGVEKGQLLACKVPATKGNPGANVAGESVEANDGQDIQVHVSDDTYYCEDDGTIRATESGVLTVVNEDTIRVLSKQKIDADIDFHTGNIRSQNCVEISGSVQPCFIVSVKGNVVIGGSIQSASVNSHGNIIVKGGILGKKSQVRVQGTAEIHHIENGLLWAGGNVVIRSAAYYASMQVGGDLHCPDSVKIIGGELVVSGSMSCGQIGTSSSKPASLAVGVDLARYHLYQNLQKEYQTLLDETQELTTRHGRANQATKVILRREKTLRAIEKELSELNLIPGTAEDSLGDRVSFYSSESITVHNTICAGSNLRIGNDTMVLTSDVSGVIIKMHRSSGRIVIDPL